MRIILFTGKGGVGKTTISAATGVQCAELGYKTIVMSTDSAHSLADSFDVQLSDEPIEVAKHLFGLEIDVQEEIKNNWGRIQAFIKQNLIKTAGFNDVIAEEFAIFPGMEELFSLLKLKGYYERDEFDVALVDCAPTGGTVRMLSFPDIAEWYMEKIFNVERRIMKLVRPLINPMVEIELPSDDVYGSVEELYRNLDGMKDILSDEKISSVRLVMNPEKMVIKESQRAYSYLNLFGFAVDSAIVNRVIPPQADGKYLGQWRDIQEKYLKDIEESFSPLRIFQAPFKDNEVVGLNLLKEIASDIYGDRDPTEVFFEERPIDISLMDGNYVLSIHLPFMEKEDVDLWTRGDELIISIKNWRRNVMLPRSLASLKVKEAKFEGERLNIMFSPTSDSKQEIGS